MNRSDFEPTAFSSLTDTDQRLLLAADEVRLTAHNPYSNISVGSAVLLDDGVVVSGSNYENASYPLCLCAERVTLAAVHAEHHEREVLRMAITISDPAGKFMLASPCGACRQVIYEFQSQQKTTIQLILRINDHEVILTTIEHLLPMGFKL